MGDMFDIGGVLNAYTAGQQNRTQQMLLQRQIKREDLQIAREDKIREIYAKITAPKPKGGDQPAAAPSITAPYSAPEATQPTPRTGVEGRPIDQTYPQGSPLSPEQFKQPVVVEQPAKRPPHPSFTADPHPSWLASNEDLINQMMALDPKEAFGLREQLSKLDDQQLEKVGKRNAAVAKAAMHLSSFGSPQAQAAELQRIAPALIAQGVTPEEINGFELTPQNLQWLQMEGMDLDKRLNPCLDRPAEMKRLIAEAEEGIEEGADAKAAKTKQSLDAAKVSPDGGELIEVPIVADEKHMAKQVVAALAKKSKELYQREGRLVRCVYKPIAGSMALDAIPLPALRSEISSVCLFTKDGEPGKYQKHIGEDIHSMRNWDGIRPIRSVVNSPVMRKDGTIWQDEGWDSQTMVYHHPSFTLPPIPNNPSKEDAKEASKVLLDIICDFPVVSDACRSAWISMVLTILFRNLVDGPCPLFFVQANMRRAGKGKMANIAANITLGKKFAANSYIHDEQEMDKRIVMFGMSGEPVCFIDNVGGPFGLKCLDAALTSTTYNARLMHTQTPVTVQMEGVWVATGNHPQTAADTGLRMLPIHIEHPMERPEQRDISECKHPDPVAEALRDRKKYVAAAFTMVRAWMAAGSPRLIKLDWGSFEAWGDFARNVCVFAGLPDPFDAREELKDADNDDVDVLASLLQGLYALTMNGTKPLSSVEIIERLKSESGPASLLKTMVTEHCGWALRGDTGNPNYLGKYLSAHRNRYAGGYKLVWSRISGKAVWCVEKAGEAKAGGAKIETLPLLPPRQLDAFGRASAHAGAGYVADPDDDTNEDKRSMPF